MKYKYLQYIVNKDDEVVIPDSDKIIGAGRLTWDKGKTWEQVVFVLRPIE